MALQVRRGTAALRTSITPVSGEPIFTTDEKGLYIGDGVTPGGHRIGGPATQIRETSGPTDLAVSGIAQNQFMRRVGNQITGAWAREEPVEFVSVASSRNLVATDHGKFLAVTGDVDLTAPSTLPANFYTNILNVGTGVVQVLAGSGVTMVPSSGKLDNTGGGTVTAATVFYFSSSTVWLVSGERQLETFAFAISDETTDLTTGLAKIRFRWPYDFALIDIRLQVSTAPTGAALIVDVNREGASILSPKLSIDDGEKTSVTAATPAGITTNTIGDDEEVSVDVDQVGSTVAGRGGKVVFYGYRI